MREPFTPSGAPLTSPTLRALRRPIIVVPGRPMRCATAHVFTGGTRRAIRLVAPDAAVPSTAITTPVSRFQPIADSPGRQ